MINLDEITSKIEAAGYEVSKATEYYGFTVTDPNSGTDIGILAPFSGSDLEDFSTIFSDSRSFSTQANIIDTVQDVLSRPDINFMEAVGILKIEEGINVDVSKEDDMSKISFSPNEFVGTSDSIPSVEIQTPSESTEYSVEIISNKLSEISSEIHDKADMYETVRDALNNWAEEKGITVENFASWLEKDSDDHYYIGKDEGGFFGILCDDHLVAAIESPNETGKSDFEALIDAAQGLERVIVEAEVHDDIAEDELGASACIEMFVRESVDENDPSDNEDDLVSTDEVTGVEERFDGIEDAIADSGLDGVFDDIDKGNGTEEAGIEASNEDVAVNEGVDDPDNVETDSAEEDWDDVEYDSYDNVD